MPTYRKCLLFFSKSAGISAIQLNQSSLCPLDLMACKYQRLLVGFCLWSVQYESLQEAEARLIDWWKYIQWWKECSGQLMHLGCTVSLPSAAYVSAVTNIHQHVAHALFHPAGWFGTMTSLNTPRVQGVHRFHCLCVSDAAKTFGRTHKKYLGMTIIGIGQKRFSATVCNNTVTTLPSQSAPCVSEFSWPSHHMLSSLVTFSIVSHDSPLQVNYSNFNP